MLIISFVCRLPSGSSSQKYPTMMMKRANPCYSRLLHVEVTCTCIVNLLELKCNAKVNLLEVTCYRKVNLLELKCNAKVNILEVTCTVRVNLM